MAKSPDLAALESTHAAEEQAESRRSLLDAPRPQRTSLPVGGVVPESDRWLGRLYEGERIVREKKPGVFDHLHSAGPHFVSVDESPLSVLDGMSQTATVPGGFAMDSVVRSYVEGGFADTPLRAADTSLGDDPAALAFAETLTSLVPGVPHVTFTNSGAEACEKAFALCLANRRDAKQTKLLAFEGSFHGRTLLSLHASFNPTKRVPFEIPGHEVTFAPFPTWLSPQDGEPTEPEGWRAAAAGSTLGAIDAGDDALLASELVSLAAVGEALATGEYFAVAIEPMQSEGGDRYATARYFRALRLLTRHHGVPLILDEVQTGFGLGGTFVWHSRFELIDAEGRPDHPDCVTFAKRAQVGAVMSCFEDPEPTAAHSASLVRGRLHAQAMANDADAARVESTVKTLLAEVAERFDFIADPRNTGYAVAFELPTTAHLMAYLGQRFWRGCIVFGAGSRTVRYRLNRSYDAAAIEEVFRSVHASLAWLEAHPDEKPPAWQDAAPPAAPAQDELEHRVREVSANEANALTPQVVALEARVYEPERRDPPEKLRRAFTNMEGVAVIAEAKVDGEWRVVGSSLGVPLEEVEAVDGVDRDPMLGRGNTLYSLATTVDPDYRGHGLGKALKRAQLKAAAARRDEAGASRYRHVCGRNRLGETDAMMHVNRAFGAYEVFSLEGQYGGEGRALYYRMPLGPFQVDVPEVDSEEVPAIDLASGLSAPFENPPPSLLAAYDAGDLYGPTVDKITICNYVTPAIVRAVEYVSALTPSHPHLYLTSSRDETFDKAFRVLKYHREAATVALGFEGAYHGHTTAAARSMSDPAVHSQGPGYFQSFRRVAHPAEVGVEACIAALRAAIDEAGAPENVAGLFLEPIQERTGRVLPEAIWPALEALREELRVPVVCSETASACYRSGDGPFYSSALDFVPDLISWWGGAQIGFIHTSPALWVAKPLTMVSTWDGDELSLIRVHHQLRAARLLDLGVAASAFEAALATFATGKLESLGAGLYRVVDAGQGAAALAVGLAERGFSVRTFPNGCVAFVPPLDLSLDGYASLGDALAEVLP